MVIWSAVVGEGIAVLTSQPSPASTKLATGPAKATMSALPGVALLKSNSVCPPHRFSTILWVVQPNIFAVTAWASSWMNTENSNKSA